MMSSANSSQEQAQAIAATQAIQLASAPAASQSSAQSWAAAMWASASV